MARPKKDKALVDEALALCRDGLTPQAAAEQLRAAGKPIAWRTIHRAREAERKGTIAAATTPTPTAPIAKGEAVAPGANGSPPRSGPPLAREQLDKLIEVAAWLPLEQQDALLAKLPVDKMRRDAIARALAPFPEAGQAVARAFQAVEASLR